MSIDEFEQYHREIMSTALNQLQRVTLYSTNLQDALEEVAVCLQTLHRTTDEFISDQRQNPDDASVSRS